MDPFYFLYIFIVMIIIGLIINIFNNIKNQNLKRKYTSYQQDQTWQKLQQYLPQNHHIHQHNQPKEFFWTWHNYSIHIDHYPNPQSTAKVILLHGVGTNGRHMSLILGQPLAQQGYEVFALDLPGYGLSKIPNRSTINYKEWINVVNDFIQQEACKDRRPIFLCGASSGGMLALHVATVNPYIKGIIGLTFLDLKRVDVQKSTMRFSMISSLSLRGLDFAVKTPLQHMKLPMSLVSKMHSLTNNRAALKIMINDPLSAGNRMSIYFLNSYVNYQPIGYFEDFRQCPVLLAQPEADLWTPLSVSTSLLKKLKVEYQVIMLPQGNHFPLEQAALDVLRHSTAHFIETYK